MRRSDASDRVLGGLSASSLRRRCPLALAAILLLAGLAPIGSLLEGGPAGAATTDLGLVSIGLDGWLHGIGYGALAAVLALTADRRSWSVLVGAAGVAIAFGAGIELLQWPLPWRTGSPFDAFANAVGAIAGAAFAGGARWLAGAE